MFAILYEFKVKPDKAQRFVELWHELTVLVKALSESGGARLHKASDNLWVGYAVWPSRTAWEDGDMSQAEVTHLRNLLLSTCDDVQIVYQLEVVDDLIVKYH